MGLTRNGVALTRAQQLDVCQGLGAEFGSDILNLNAQSVAKWIKARNNALAGLGRARVVCIGNSKTAGVNSTSLRTQSVPAYIARAMVAAGLPAFSQSVTGSSEDSITIAEYVARDPQMAFGAGWVVGNETSLGGKLFRAPSSGNVTTAATYTSPIICDKVLFGYARSTPAGSFVYSINGGADSAPVTIQQGTAGGFAFMNIDVPRGSGNTIAFKRTSGSADFFFDFIMPYDSTTSQIEVINAGWGASTSSDWVASNVPRESLNVLKSLAPNLTIIKGPTNDYTPSYGPTPLATFEANLQALVTAAKVSGDAALVAETPSAPSRQTQAVQDQYNAVMKAVALANNCPFFDNVAHCGGYDAIDALGYLRDTTHLHPIGYAFEGMWIGRALATVQ